MAASAPRFLTRQPKLLAGIRINPAVSAVWTLVTTTNGVERYAPGKFTIDTSGFIDAPSESGFSVALSEDGNSLNLVYAVPESGMVALIGFGLGALLLHRRVIRALPQK